MIQPPSCVTCPLVVQKRNLNQSRKAWVAELGLTHEAFYLTLRRLQTDRTLDIDGNRIVIVRAATRQHAPSA
jgi:hypothetical protein